MYRYNRDWIGYGIGRALVNSMGWLHAVPRVGGIFPGITTPIPVGTVPTLDECIDQHAMDLLSRYDDIIVLWSGGIDSTLVAVALATMKTTQNIYITISPQSLNDSSDALRHALHRIGCIPIELSIPILQDRISRGYHIITGTHADSITLGELADASNIHDDIWDMSLEQVISMHMKIPEKTSASYIRVMSPIFDEMPLERTTVNMAFWLDFTCCWSRDEYDFTYRLELGPPGIGHSNFFGTELFQRWAMQDSRKKIRRGDTKYMYRNYINRKLGESMSYKKNLMHDSLQSPTYLTTLYHPNLRAINADYSLTFVS